MTTKLLIDRELLPCPFCGDRPELPSGEGTQYEIECSGCGQAMASVQICDLMSVEERAADSFTNYRYADEFVERAKKQAIESWNTRAAPARQLPRSGGHKRQVICRVCSEQQDELATPPQPADVGELVEALRAADEYLSSNRFNEIGSGSILHRQMQAALSKLEGKK